MSQCLAANVVAWLLGSETFLRSPVIFARKLSVVTDVLGLHPKTHYST